MVKLMRVIKHFWRTSFKTEFSSKKGALVTSQIDTDDDMNKKWK